MKPPKIKVQTDQEVNSDGDDIAMEDFADKAVEDKMKDLQRGSGVIDESDDDVDIEYSENESE